MANRPIWTLRIKNQDTGKSTYIDLYTHKPDGEAYITREGVEFSHGWKQPISVDLYPYREKPE